MASEKNQPANLPQTPFSGIRFSGLDVDLLPHVF